MKKLTDKEIQAIAKEIFAYNKKLTNIFITEDGQVFDNENLARSHNRDVKGVITPFERGQRESGTRNKPTAEDAIREKALSLIELMKGDKVEDLKKALKKSKIPQELIDELLSKQNTHGDE